MFSGAPFSFQSGINSSNARGSKTFPCSVSERVALMKNKRGLMSRSSSTTLPTYQIKCGLQLQRPFPPHTRLIPFPWHLLIASAEWRQPIPAGRESMANQHEYTQIGRAICLTAGPAPTVTTSYSITSRIGTSSVEKHRESC